MIRKTILLTAALLATPAGAAATAAEEAVIRARAALEDRVARKATVGIAAGIVLPDGSLRVVTAGSSGNRARPEVDALTIFEIGSITKVFTATLLAQRVERGELALGTTLRESAPTLRKWRTPGVGDATLGQLATHTAGLPRLPRDPWLLATAIFSREGPYGLYSAERFLDFASRADPPGPGPHTFTYSNYGVALLGEVLARREGLDWDALVRRDILAPLGMARTGVTTREADLALLARGHDESLRRNAYWSIPGMGGAGALRSNVAEMAAFLAAQRAGTLAGARLTQAPQGKSFGRNETGLGWVIRPAKDGRILWHNGGTGGFRSFAGFHEGTGLGVVVLSNSAASVDDIGLHVLDATVPLAPPDDNSPPAWLLVVVAFVAGSIPWAAWRAKPATRLDASWTALEMATAALLLHLLAPWAWLGPVAWPALAAATIASIAIVAWRARRLAWRDPAAPRRYARAAGRALTAIVFAACAVRL